MTDFAGVVSAWRKADPSHIHPLRNVSEDDYWASGRAQAEQAAQWIEPGGTVVDFGCGDGRLTLPLLDLGFDVFAVDASPAMLARVESRTQDAHTILSDGTTDLAKLIGEKVDAVVARAVLIHHSHSDVAVIVRTLSKCLKPGGVFIADWPLGPHHERRDWIDVTTWELAERKKVADANGLELINDGSVWRKA